MSGKKPEASQESYCQKDDSEPDPLDQIETSCSSFEPSSGYDEGQSSSEEGKKTKKKRISQVQRTPEPTGDVRRAEESSKKGSEFDGHKRSQLNLSHGADDLNLSLNVDKLDLPDGLRERIENIFAELQPTPAHHMKLAGLDIQVPEIHPNHRMSHGLRKSDICGKPGVRTDAFDESEMFQIQQNWTNFCKEYRLDPEEDLIPFLPDPFTGNRKGSRALSIDQKIKFCQYLAQGLTNRHPLGVYHKFLSMYWYYKKGTFTPEENELIEMWYRFMPSKRIYAYLSRMLHRRKNNIYNRLLSILNVDRLHSSKRKLPKRKTDKRRIKDAWALGDSDDYPEWVYDKEVWDKIAASSKADKKTLMKDFVFHIYPSVRGTEPISLDDESFQHQVIEKMVSLEPKTWDDPIWEKLGDCNNIGEVAAYIIVRRVTKKHVPKDKWFDIIAVCETLKMCYLKQKSSSDEELESSNHPGNCKKESEELSQCEGEPEAPMKKKHTSKKSHKHNGQEKSDVPASVDNDEPSADSPKKTWNKKKNPESMEIIESSPSKEKMRKKKNRKCSMQADELHEATQSETDTLFLLKDVQRRKRRDNVGEEAFEVHADEVLRETPIVSSKPDPQCTSEEMVSGDTEAAASDEVGIRKRKKRKHIAEADEVQEMASESQADALSSRKKVRKNKRSRTEGDLEKERPVEKETIETSVVSNESKSDSSLRESEEILGASPGKEKRRKRRKIGSHADEYQENALTTVADLDCGGGLSKDRPANGSGQETDQPQSIMGGELQNEERKRKKKKSKGGRQDLEISEAASRSQNVDDGWSIDDVIQDCRDERAEIRIGEVGFSTNACSQDMFAESEEVRPDTSVPNHEKVSKDVEKRVVAAVDPGSPSTSGERREVVLPKIGPSKKSRPSMSFSQRDIESWLIRKYQKTKEIEEDETSASYVAYGSPERKVVHETPKSAVELENPEVAVHVTPEKAVQNHEPTVKPERKTPGSVNKSTGPTGNNLSKTHDRLKRNLLGDLESVKSPTKVFPVFERTKKTTPKATPATHAKEDPPRMETPPVSQRLRKRTKL